MTLPLFVGNDFTVALGASLQGLDAAEFSLNLVSNDIFTYAFVCNQTAYPYFAEPYLAVDDTTVNMTVGASGPYDGF